MAIITSTIGTSGRTYSTPQAWEDALPANAVTAGNSYVGELYADSEFAASAPIITFGGTTTDSTHTITLKAAAGQSFYDNANKLTNALKYNAANGVALRATGAFQVSTIEVGSQYVTLDGLQVSMDVSGGYSAINMTSANCTIKNCIAYSITGNNRSVIANGSTATITNVLAIQAGATSASGFDLSGGGTVVACTAVRIANSGGTAFSRNYASPLIRDCAGFGFTKFGKDTTAAGGSGYNCTDVASGNTPGSNNLNSKTFASQFVDITNTGAMDFRVKAGADLINAGTRDATNTADLDIVNSARSTTTPTIGAWEYAAAGGGSFQPAWAVNSNVLIQSGMPR